MKTLFTSLTATFLLSGALHAQPVISHGEYYHIGDVVHMVNCDTTGLNAGASGAGATWDYSGLAPLGPMVNTTYSAETSSEFITSNMVATVSTGIVRHEQASSTTTYINGIQDVASGVMSYYRSYPIAKRPFTYASNYVDTFYKTVTATGEHGSGVLQVTGDAYGSLTLPTGTYSPVLRVKRLINELDTTTASNLSYTTVSYLWFDTVHTSPLLRIDSMYGSGGQRTTAMYLANPTSVSSVIAKEGDFAGYLAGNALTVTGTFESGISYEVTMYNVIGTQIFKGELLTTAGSYRFDIARDVAPGIYIVGITQKNDPSTKQVIKVMKQ